MFTIIIIQLANNIIIHLVHQHRHQQLQCVSHQQDQPRSKLLHWLDSHCHPNVDCYMSTAFLRIICYAMFYFSR